MIILSLFMVLSTTRKVIARPKPRTYQALASSVSRYRPLRGRLFLFTLGGGDDSPAHIKTLQKLPLADPGFVHCEVAEWGYSFHHLKDGQEDGAGRKHYGGYPRPPKTRAEAMEVVRRYYLEQRKESLARSSPEQQKCVVSINGHYCYQHYACEWGCDVVGSEVGENVNSIQAHIAFTRGAARQYGKPWLIDFSDWYGPGIRDEDPTRHWGGDSGPTYGHSISLTTRTYYVSYMAGANVVVAEGGWLNGFRSQKPQADGTLPLSSLGKAMGEFYRFTRRHPDRGIPYTPIALVLPVDHGVYPGFGPKLAWHAFDYEPGDQHILDTLNVFFPGSLGDPDQAERADGQPLSPPAGDPSWNSPPYARTEALRLVASPYGDIVDTLLSDASSETLSGYPALILAGVRTPESGLAQRLDHYVQQGGTLFVYAEDARNHILTKALSERLPEPPEDGYVRVRYGRGAVVVLAPSHSGQPATERPLGKAMARAARELIPLDISGDLETLFNRTKDGWIVTLVNNKGITKAFHEDPRVDASAARTVTIAAPGDDKIRKATLWGVDHDRELAPANIRVTVPPGETRIVHVLMKNGVM